MLRDIVWRSLSSGPHAPARFVPLCTPGQPQAVFQVPLQASRDYVLFGELMTICFMIRGQLCVCVRVCVSLFSNSYLAYLAAPTSGSKCLERNVVKRAV